MSNDAIKWQPEQVALLKKTVAKDATEPELQMFLEFCKSTGLNPFRKEIWFIKTKDSVQMMTGINGFLRIANNHPQFDGMEVSIEEWEGKVISATAKVYRKDRKFPSVATVYLQEYFKPSYKGNGMWEKMPRMMLQKVAKSVALREAFPQELNGIYTQEEMLSEYALNSAENRPEALESQTVYKYAVQKFNEQEKCQKALEWCETHKVDTVWTDKYGVIAESPKPLPFFKEVEVEDKE